MTPEEKWNCSHRTTPDQIPTYQPRGQSSGGVHRAQAVWICHCRLTQSSQHSRPSPLSMPMTPKLPPTMICLGKSCVFLRGYDQVSSILTADTDRPISRTGTWHLWLMKGRCAIVSTFSRILYYVVSLRSLTSTSITRKDCHFQFDYFKWFLRRYTLSNLIRGWSK